MAPARNRDKIQALFDKLHETADKLNDQLDEKFSMDRFDKLLDEAIERSLDEMEARLNGLGTTQPQDVA